MAVLKHRVIEIDWPEFGEAEQPPRPDAAALEARVARTLASMERRGLTHLLVYADREHSANLAWLTHFDPRFEEALLVLRPDALPLILVGNECEAYLRISSLPMRHEVFPDFSPLDQPRLSRRSLSEIFREEGIGPGARAGLVGWKTYRSPQASDLPSYIVDEVRSTGAAFENATGLLASAADGLRCEATAAEIAFFEYTNAQASDSMRRMLFGLRPGMTDRDVVALARYDGLPLAAHMSCKTGPKRISLASASGAIVEQGQPLSANVCYWGANICRAGWVAEGAADAPPGYVEDFAGPYFEAMAAWLDLLRIGTPGGELHHAIHSRLPFDKYGIFLNAGHLIHYDEWLNSPVYEGSTIPIRSGMVMQTDVIPSSPVYFSTRMEDGAAIAGAALRKEIQTGYPDCWRRCAARREFASSTLGLSLPEEVLPLSNTFGLVPPWLLRPRHVFAMR